MPEVNTSLLPWADDTAAIRGSLAVAPLKLHRLFVVYFTSATFCSFRSIIFKKLAFIRHSFCCKCSVYLF